MGNVQCCASGRRFPEGKPQNKPKEKKKKAKGLKGVTKKTNGAGAGKGNGSVQKVITVAEDKTERAAPAGPQTEVLAQAAPPVNDASGPQVPQDHNTTQRNPQTEETDAAAPNESIAVARERFFNQVGATLPNKTSYCSRFQSQSGP